MIKVFSNGCYDVLHIGHLRLLEYAKSLGDKLYVAIDSDNRVRKNKGEGRPINNQKTRAEQLGHIKHVDCIFLFDSPQQLEDTIRLIKPDIMVIGEEYRNKNIIGSEFIKEIVFFKRVPDNSSTNIINKTGLKKDDENEQWAYM